MKKKILSLIVAMTTAVTLIGCGTKETATDAAPAAPEAAEEVTEEAGEGETAAAEDAAGANLDLITQGVLTIGVDDTMPPMEYRDENNELVGFDIEMGNEIGKRLGLEVNWVPTDWDGLLLGLSSKKYDAVISLICVNDQRKETMDFSDPYYVLEELIITSADNEEIKAVADLPGKKVGCQTGSANYMSLTAMEGINPSDIFQYNAVTDELNDIKTGRLDCAVMESTTAYYYAQMQEGFKVIGSDPIEGHDVAVTFDKGNETLVNAVNEVLAELKEDGTLSALSVKWFGEDIYAK